jgi:hypothetical protein
MSSKSRRRRRSAVSAARPTLEPRSRSPAAPGCLPIGDPGGSGGRVIEAPETQLLVGLITTGGFDDHLGTIQAAISRRHRELARDASNRRAAELTIGDRVRLSRDIRPLYLRGATGTVVGWASQNVVLQLDDPAGRFATGQLRCPPLGLERLS